MSNLPLHVSQLIAEKAKSNPQQKPVFLSKEERQKLALQRRMEQVEERIEKRTLTNQKPKAPQLPEEPKVLGDKELAAIRNRFVGIEAPKRKVRKLHEKKFLFDWKEEEDTSADINPIYSKRHDAQLFGRGRIGGFEAPQNHTFYDNLVEKRVGSIAYQCINSRKPKQSIPDRKSNFDERHWSDKELSEMKDRDWRIFKEDFQISTKGGQVPNPIRSWSESEIPTQILSVILTIGYTTPTPIQRQAVPIGLAYRDIIGVAETGSGKTAAFVIPMLNYILELPTLDDSNFHLGPYALILAPTRELAIQIESETTKFCKSLGLVCVSVVGGHAIEEQSFSMRSGSHIVIATPGRLKDCLDRRVLVLAQCRYVVMDEADRMVEMGFEADVTYILNSLPSTNLRPLDEEDVIIDGQKGKYRQTIMFSATMPPAVERIAKTFLRKPIVVTVGVAGQAVDRIEQRVEMIHDENRKKDRLLDILNGTEFKPPIIVFVNQKKSCDYLYRCTTLHSGKSQEQRESALNGLKVGTKDILIATDVAARGIDVKNVSLVVNYDMAKNIQEYTHRIGRTGRAGMKGVAITFLGNQDTEVFYDLKVALSKSSISRVPPELANHEATLRRPEFGARLVTR